MTGAGGRYDEIGRTYATTRQEDPRVAVDIHACLGPPGPLVNVGAGTGNYEPTDRCVVAVEPSRAMLAQRRPGAAPAVRAEAERLPFEDGAFAAALAILTVHHWNDRVQGLREMARVARRQVVFYFEPLETHRFWALEYFPEARALPTEVAPPGAELIRSVLEVRDIRKVLVPNDCRDGFGVSFWARPEAYLDPQVQAGMSWLALLDPDDRDRGTRRLRHDLGSGAWDRRFGHLRHEPTYDGGYRIAIAGPAADAPRHRDGR